MVQNFKVREAVEASVFKQVLQPLFLFLLKGKHQRADGRKAKIQLLIQFFKLPAALVAHAAFELGVGFGVAAVDNGRVCLGGAHRHIVFLFKQGDFEIIAGELTGNARSDDSSTDYYNIVHLYYLLDSLP